MDFTRMKYSYPHQVTIGVLTPYFCRNFFVGILSLFLLSEGLMAQVTVTADWTTMTGTSPSHLFGVNAWSGCILATATNTAYINCLSAMNPGLIRYQNAVTMSAYSGDSDSTWIDPVNQIDIQLSHV